MKCSQCGHSFCWLCMREVDDAVFPNHYQWWNVTGCPNRQLYDVALGEGWLKRAVYAFGYVLLCLMVLPIALGITIACGSLCCLCALCCPEHLEDGGAETGTRGGAIEKGNDAVNLRNAERARKERERENERREGKNRRWMSMKSYWVGCFGMWGNCTLCLLGCVTCPVWCFIACLSGCLEEPTEVRTSETQVSEAQASEVELLAQHPPRPSPQNVVIDIHDQVQRVGSDQSSNAQQLA